MQKTVKFTVFKTKWGYFGLAFAEKKLLRTVLPTAKHEKAGAQLLKNIPFAQYDRNLFKAVQEYIVDYFEGERVDFSTLPVVLDGLSAFARRVLTACRSVEFGKTISYSRLAKIAGRPGTARAVGGVLAKNPLPLIIPCHRIICADGSIGGFSATGGINLKKKMLLLEGANLLV